MTTSAAQSCGRVSPSTLADFRNVHRDETILVCGCGESLNRLEHPERFITIGVNDVGRRFTPDYLVVVNPRSQFSGDRFGFVERSRAAALFTQIPDLGVPHPNIVRFRLGRYGGTDDAGPDALHYTRNSPYVAVCLAMHMGARRIGLLGVDFTEHHFFGRTGPHSLASRLPQIQREYTRLAESCRARGIELVNLSATSRLTVLPRATLHEFGGSLAGSAGTSTAGRRRVFFVNYRFLSCGDVFAVGLSRAADLLGVEHQAAWWDDPQLAAKVKAFAPDLVFVVHGRHFAQRWKGALREWKRAVWLLDEPYEVDDTSRWSSAFDTVFLNDPVTLARHENAYPLPTCFDPLTHHDPGAAREYTLGFVGGYNPVRERCLVRLADEGLLSYVVGGPWTANALRKLRLTGLATPAETARLYQHTRIVLNVFRSVHHFNRRGLAATALNPRIFEALACGALVVTEPRPALAATLPELPTFTNSEDLVSTVRRLLADPDAAAAILAASRARLASHDYTHRLATALDVTLGEPARSRLHEVTGSMQIHTLDSGVTPPAGWMTVGREPAAPADGVLVLTAGRMSEAGLTTLEPFRGVRLSLDVQLDATCRFIAKLHQAVRGDPTADSYHVLATPTATYLARQHVVLAALTVRRGKWQRLEMTCAEGGLTVAIDEREVCRCADTTLDAGYCFIGVTEGSAEVRGLRVEPLPEQVLDGRPAVHVTDPLLRGGFSVVGLEAGRAEFGALAVREVRSAIAGGALARVHPPAAGRDPLPFTTTPRRNLIYHVWPVRGPMWRRNIEQLRSRLDLFNGRRVIGIVHDERSEDPDEVRKMLEGHGCEFICARNGPAGEGVTFPSLLERVRSLDPNEVTFYAHAKGVRFEPSIPRPVSRWTDVMYQAALDHWPTVRPQLERFAMTGSFKMRSRVRAHRFIGDWHYSGTFFWLRHARVFARDIQKIESFYGCVEAWPGMHFRHDETGCLFMDDLRELPYREAFWARTGNQAFARWEAANPSPSPPVDLVTPLPFEGYVVPRLEQHPEEFAWFLRELVEAAPRRILSIGSLNGGVEWHIARRFRAIGRDVHITAIDVQPRHELQAAIAAARREFNQDIELVVGDSTAVETRARLAPQYDAVFIDADHTYRGVRADMDFALTRSPSLVALHDVVDSDWHAQARCCVSRLWSELRARHSTEERVVADWGGIGIVRLSR